MAASALRVGMIPPVDLTGGDPQRVATTLAAMADAGIDHAVVGDHVSFFGGMGFDGLVHATALAMLHPTLAVQTAVYLLPLRHPVPVARQVATIEGLAPGRLTLGVGLGGEDPHELEVCGIDPRTRGARMEECLTVLRGLLTGEPVTFHGAHVDVTDAHIVPAAPVPVVVGGRSEAAIRRGGRLGDGWLGIWVSPERFARSVADFGEEAERAGRAGPWSHGLSVWCGFGGDRASARTAVGRAMEGIYQLPFERFERWCPYGSPAEVADQLAPYVEAGCPSFHLLPRGPSAEATIEAVAEVKHLLATG
jgi:alkanesulfonate monooxygenase SsuD/methylene tetrahydromethanopterin reductase-like flavin-dependent oxidoreductase (luciferase family)